jgi:hypothetical protein
MIAIGQPLAFPISSQKFLVDEYLEAIHCSFELFSFLFRLLISWSREKKLLEIK